MGATRPTTTSGTPTLRPAAGEPCLECTEQQRLAASGSGWVWASETVVVHRVIGGSPLAGWLVVAPRVHAERLEDLPPAVRDEIFALATRIGAAQRRVLAAEKAYVALFAEVVAHVHVHVIPRYADTPGELRGPRCFLAEATRQLGEDQLAAAAARIAAALAEPG